MAKVSKIQVLPLLKSRASLIAEAAALVAKDPQYKDRFENYTLAVTLKAIREQGETMFEKGESVLVDTDSVHFPKGTRGGFHMDVWSLKTKEDISVRLADLMLKE